MTQFNEDPQEAGGPSNPSNQQGTTGNQAVSNEQAPAFGQQASNQQGQAPQTPQAPQAPQAQPQMPQAPQAPQAQPQPQYGQAAPVQGYGQPVQQPQPTYGQGAPQPQYGQQTQYGQPPVAQPSYPQVAPVFNGQMGENGQPVLTQPWYGISFIAAIKRFFTKYADFSGRASKGEFWWSILFIFLVSVVLGIITAPLHSTDVSNIVGYIWDLIVLVPVLAVTTRRVHDANMSGWWTALPAVLFIGGAAIASNVASGIDPDIIMNQDVTAMDPSQVMTMGWSGMAAFAGLIIWIIFGVRASNPQGAHFDKNIPSQPMQPMQ
ncbi:hypothetical protein KIM372_15070 [Bombiscardovia nodaiensis]|uniref:DUF805 domain-containing protein n=1 Tax=Bombiscardovia nodaiensis TaxID=2932181 RepID=A0ABM8B9W3_9BIFI|nr:hypothetical protein KIM372_15070 [Bombiscardovia nodaiensis]